MQDIGRLDAVALCVDGEGAAGDADIAPTLVILTVQAVFLRLNCERAVTDRDGIICFYRIECTCDRVGTAGDLQVVLAGDTVAFAGIDRQGAGAVKRHILPGKDDRIRIGFTVSPECAGHCKQIFTGAGNENLVGAFDIDCREVAVRNAYIVQYKLDFCLFIGIYQNRAVCGTSLYEIDALLRYRDCFTVPDLDGLCCGGIRSLGHVTVCEKGGCIKLGAGSGG